MSHYKIHSISPIETDDASTSFKSKKGAVNEKQLLKELKNLIAMLDQYVANKSGQDDSQSTPTDSTGKHHQKSSHHTGATTKAAA